MRRPTWLSRGLVVAGLVLGLALPAQAAGVGLVGRLAATPGDTDYQAYYDVHQDITWAANANINNGRMNWSNANNWATTLTLGGVSGWRLPTTTQPDPSCSDQAVNAGFPDQGFGFGCTGSEMGYLFNGEGITAAAPGVFSNVQSDFYWSGTEFAPFTNDAWFVFFGNGSQNANLKSGNGFFAWAVRSGDVSAPAAVPAPGTMMLMGSGLIGLLAWRRFGRG